jgi:hypothetical protein
MGSRNCCPNKICPPFLANPDEAHCFQCVIGMILARDFPERSVSFEELVRFTGKKPGMWTWPARGLIEMQKLGYNILIWEEFSYQELAVRGGAYLLERFGVEKGQAQIDHCDLAYEMANARELEAVVNARRGLPGWEDMAQLVREGYLVVCNVNSRALNGEPGYNGHFVLIYRIDEDRMELHDPGPPAVESRTVMRSKFLRAWEYPSERERNLMAFKF